MTNDHVIESVAVARKTKVEFNYQLPLGQATSRQPPCGTTWIPAHCSAFSPRSALDYTVVAVKPDADPDKPAVESWERRA